MNLFYEADLKALCASVRNKISQVQAHPDAAEQASWLEKLQYLIGKIEAVAEALGPEQRDSLCTIPLPGNRNDVMKRLSLLEEETRLQTEDPGVSPSLRDFLELDKLVDLLQRSRESLVTAILRWEEQQAICARLDSQSTFGSGYSASPYRFADASREIPIREDLLKPGGAGAAGEEAREMALERQQIRRQEQLPRFEPGPGLTGRVDGGGRPSVVGRPMPSRSSAGDRALHTKAAGSNGKDTPGKTKGFPVPETAGFPKNKPEKERKGLLGGLFGRKKGGDKPKEEDDVQFRIAAPDTISPGEYFPVKLMMYLEEDYARADREQATLGQRIKAAASSILKARRDQLFRITLRSPDVPELCASETLRWNGRYATVDMELLLPEDFDKKQLRLHGRVYADDAVVTDLKVILQANAPQPQVLPCEKCVLRSAFISYASADRAQVASRIQGIQLAAPEMDLFFDVESLHRGERWEPRLFQEIDKRDLFYLFWSKNAAQSPWVARELAYAISRKGVEWIEPVPLEPPESCPPPEELRDRHFNDWTLRYRKD